MTRQIPMLFSPAMVEALLAGRKTETRRITKLQSGTYFKKVQMPNPEFIGWQTNAAHGRGPSQVHIGPQVGDMIWVKEAHYAFGWWKTTDELTKKTQKPKRQFVSSPEKNVRFDAPSYVMTGQPEQRPGWYKRSSLFLPKLESRLTLRVTGFNIEQLHDICDKAAIAEGVECAIAPIAGHDIDIDGDYWPGGPVRMYQQLWNRINGADAWDANPWVDVTQFDVLHQNVQEVAA